MSTLILEYKTGRLTTIAMKAALFLLLAGAALLWLLSAPEPAEPDPDVMDGC